jgi:alpha-L-fucosidase
MNQTVRALQPHIIIDNRSQLPEDFGTPEGRVSAEQEGREWEACMTFNGVSWGYMPSAAPEAHTARDILWMLNTAAAGQGNLLLNIGPAPDGSVPEAAVEPLTTVGKWLKKNGKAVYGETTRGQLGGTACGRFTIKGNTAYFWCKHWPGSEMTFGGIRSKLKKASFLTTGKAIKFEQTRNQLKLKGMPKSSPDKIAGITIIKLDFASKPKYVRHPTTMGAL